MKSSKYLIHKARSVTKQDRKPVKFEDGFNNFKKIGDRDTWLTLHRIAYNDLQK